MTFDPNKFKKSSSEKPSSGFNPNDFKKKTKDQDSMDSPSVSAQSTSLLGLESRPEEQPDWLVQNSSQAQTSSLKSLKDSIEWYQDFYKDAPFALIDEKGSIETLPRGKQLSELRGIYNERAKKEAPIKERASILKSDAYKKYLSENIEKGFLTEDEANSLAPTDVFELVATNKLSSDNLQGWGPRVFGTETMSVEEMTDKIKKSSIQSEIKDLSEKTKNEILATIPEEERTPEKLAELEQELYTKADLFINLNPEESSVVGLDFNQGLLNTITEKSRLLGKVGIQLVSDLTNTIVDITESATGAEGLEYQPIFLGGLSPKTLELSAKELDSKITKYESDSFDALMSGDLMEVANQSINMMIESAPYTAIAALSPNVYASYALIGGLVANQQYNQVKDQDWFTDLNAIEKAGYLTAYGAFEGIGETVGGVVLKNTVKNLLVPSLKETAENSLKQFIKGYAKSLGISLREEFLAEAVTGVGQLVTDAAAKGELDKIDLDMILDTAIRQGTSGALAGGGRTTATASIVGAVRTPEFLGLMNKQKGLIDEMNKANTLEEKEIILNQIEDLQTQSDRLRKAHQQVVNQMSSEDLFTYSGALAKFNELKIKYDSLKNKGVAEGAAAQAIKKQMADAVKVIDDIQNKYKSQQESTQPVQETEVFTEPEQGGKVNEEEVDVERNLFDELSDLEEQIAKEERIRKDRQQPQRKPRPEQIERPDQAKPVLAMEMLGEKVQDENGVVGTITEENGRLVWASEDGSLVREGGSTEDAPTVTLKDMNLSIIPSDITEPVGLTQGEPVGVPPLTNEQKQELMLEEAITKEELDALPEKEFEKILAESEKEVERFNEEILKDVERESKRDERLIFKLGGRTFAVGLNKEGGNTVSEKNSSGRFVAVGDTKLREDAVAEYNRLREDRESQRLQDALDLTEEFKKEQEDKFLSLLDAAIDATSTKGKLYDGTLGLPLFVANSSLKVVRAAYKAGKSLSEAINDGIKYLKSKGYNIDELEYRKYVVNELKKPTKPQSNAPKKPSPKKVPVGKQSQTSQKVRGQNAKGQEATKESQKEKVNPKKAVEQTAANFKEGTDFAKAIKEALEPFTKKGGKVTNKQASAIAQRASKVKDASTLGRFINYASKVLERAEYVAELKEAKRLQKQVKTRFKNGNLPTNSSKTFYAINLNIDELTPDELQGYISFLEKSMARNFMEDTVRDEIQMYYDMYQKKESSGTSVGEQTIKNAEASRQSLLNSIKLVRTGVDHIRLKSKEDGVYETLTSLTEDEVNSLSKRDAETAMIGIQLAMNESLFTKEVFDLVRKIRVARGKKDFIEIMDGAKVKKLFRDSINFIKSRQGMIENYINKNPLKNIGMLVKGIEQTKLYKDFIQPISISYSEYLGEVRAHGNKLDKLFKKVSEIEDIRIHMIAIAIQKESNLKDDTIPSIEQVMEEAKVEADRNEEFKKSYKKYEEAYNGLLDKNGKFDIKTAEGKLTKQGLAALDYIIDYHNKNIPKVATASVINGNGVKVYNNYSPLYRLYTSSKDISDIKQEANNFVEGVPPKSVNLKERTKNKHAILLGARESSMRSTNSVLRDYYMRNVLMTFKQTMDAIQKDSNVKGITLDTAKALNEQLVGIVDSLFINVDYDGTLSTKIKEYVKIVGYFRDLVSIGRAVVDLGSNFLHASVFSPMNTAKGMNILTQKQINGKKFTDEQLVKMAIKAKTAQFNRIFQGEGGSARQDLGTGFSKSLVGKRTIQFGEKLKEVSNYTLSKADNLIAKPLWLGNFISEFEKQSGVKFEMERFLSDIDYYSENLEAINKARDIADERLTQGFSSMNPFESVPFAQMSKDQGWMATWDKYMSRFRITEFASVAKAVNNLVYGGEMSPREASALLAATFLRMGFYNYFILKIPAVTANLIAAGFGMELDDEEIFKDWDTDLKKTTISTALQILLARRLGNIGSVALVYGVELANMEFGDDLGLREKEKYKGYTDALMYSQTVAALKLGKDYKGAEMLPVNILASTSGPYNKVVTRTADLMLNLYKGGVTVPFTDTQLIKPSLKTNAAIKRANAKAAADALDLSLTLAGIPFARDVANVNSYIVYEKNKNKKKKRTGLSGGLSGGLKGGL